MVAGGGMALLQAADALDKPAADRTGDERTGIEIAHAACAAPICRIAQNAGREGTVVLAELADQPAGKGYDAARDRYVDLFEAGIVDPLRVVRTAIEAAFSVAGTTLLTEAGVTKAREAAEVSEGGGDDL